MALVAQSLSNTPPQSPTGNKLGERSAEWDVTAITPMICKLFRPAKLLPNSHVPTVV